MPPAREGIAQAKLKANYKVQAADDGYKPHTTTPALSGGCLCSRSSDWHMCSSIVHTEVAVRWWHEMS
jgi:hypothetical protein